MCKAMTKNNNKKKRQFFSLREKEENNYKTEESRNKCRKWRREIQNGGTFVVFARRSMDSGSVCHQHGSQCCTPKLIA